MAIQSNLELPSLQGLQSTKQMELLNIIDSLRAEGLGDLLSLPQLIVCGDQSSGKSSVLEAISGIPFPRQEGTCTRFATEVVLRRASTRTISVSIVPSRDRAQSDKSRLEDFRHNITATEDIPGLYQEATEAMGLSASGKSFSKDILKLELCGPGQPQLTLVDLPGLIQSATGTQTQADVDMVNDMVQSYIHSDRSIILAVVNAAYDTNNQAIIKLVRQMDPTGKRILGIITKPDKVVGAFGEHTLRSLARNEVVKFKLGWHVVKNLDLALEENRNVTLETRDKLEDEFFRTGFLKNLPSRDTGIARLRTRLSEILFRQIQLELPNVIKDIEIQLVVTKAKRDKLGPSRIEIEEQRHFLIQLSQNFHIICRAAIRGDYEHEFFESVRNDEARLCADFMNKHSEFARNLRKNGKSWKIVESEDRKLDELRPCRTRAEAILEARKTLRGSRGRELPGMFNFAVVGDLFREYSYPWKDLAEAHISNVWDSTSKFLELVLRYLTDDETCEKIQSLWLNEKMEERRQSAIKKLDELLTVHKEHPMTMNYRLMSAVGSNALSDSGDEEEEGNNSHFSDDDSEEETNKRKARRDGIPANRHPDLIAAEKALDHMNAYYKVAMNLFMDNVPTLAVQAPIIRKLEEEFCPEAVSLMDPAKVKAIAEESVDKARDREKILSSLAALEAGARICRQYAVVHHTAIVDPRRNRPISGEQSVPKASNTESPQIIVDENTDVVAGSRPKSRTPKVRLLPSQTSHEGQVPGGPGNNSRDSVSTPARQPSPLQESVISAAAASSTAGASSEYAYSGLFAHLNPNNTTSIPTTTGSNSSGGDKLFGSTISPPRPASSSGFGSSSLLGGTASTNTMSPAPSSSMFGASNPFGSVENSRPSGVFGQKDSTNTTASASSTGGFGSFGTGGPFGQISNNTAPPLSSSGPSLFGAKPSSTTGGFGSGQFGQLSTNIASPAGKSLFGAQPSSNVAPSASSSGAFSFGDRPSSTTGMPGKKTEKSRLRDSNDFKNIYNHLPLGESSAWVETRQPLTSLEVVDVLNSIAASSVYKNFSFEELRQVYYEDMGIMS